MGKGFFQAADALEFGGSYHTGLRKDGITPEFQHQVEITHYLRTLIPLLMFPEETLTASLLHDVTEDHGVTSSTITERYGHRVSLAVQLLDKNGKSPDFYFSEIANNPIASIVKGGDRMHNIQTMVGVFSPEKQLKYINEVEDHFLPMLKIARRKFVSQESAYENIKHILTSQIELLKVVK